MKKKEIQVMILNIRVKTMISCCKPLIIGFLCFLAILMALTLIYATSQLEPLTGNWHVCIDGDTIDTAFPISFVLDKEEEIAIKKTIHLPPNRDFLTFSVYPTLQGELLIDGHVIAEIQPEKEMIQNTPPYLFLSYQIPQELLNEEVEVTITAKGPQGIYLSYPPMLSNSEIIKQSTFRVHFVESYIFILAVGVQLVIVFLMFVIGKSMPSLRQSYLNIGFGELLQAIYLVFIILAFNTSLFQDSPFYNYFVPLLMVVSFIFLFQGLEYYILKQYRLTKYFWLGVPGILLFYLLVPFSNGLKHQISIIYFLFMNVYMIYLSVAHTKIKLLQYSLFILFFSILSDFYFRAQFRVFPLPTMQQNALMIMSFVFGSFFTYQFLKNFKEEKRLRVELSESLEEVRAVNEELEISYQEIEALNNSLEEKVEERTRELNYTMRDLRMIMNNTEQGFLTLDKSLCIEPTYSKECEIIFNQELNNVFFPSLIFPEDPDEAAFVEKIIQAIHHEDDDLKRTSYLSLLPEELVINGLFVELEYKWIEDAIPGDMQLMVVLNDVTKRIELENRIEDERNKLSKIIKIILNIEEFRRMEADYRDFVNHEMKSLLGQSCSKETFIVIKRRLHTFKGGFASFGLRFIEKQLHALEDKMQNDINNQPGELSEIRCEQIFDAEQMCLWLIKEEEIIKSEISDCIPCENGKIFRDDASLRIYPEQITTVRKSLKKWIPEEYHNQIDEALSKLEKMRIREFLNYYRYIVDNIAEKLGKMIQPLVIEGDDVYIDPQRIGKWADSLIHIFRNAIDHGIESTEERLLMNKPQYGQIRLKVKDMVDFLRIEISDDGRGIDKDKIREKALKKGLTDLNHSEQSNEKGILETIFLDGFTTKDNINLISGRGTGLSAVKNEWEKLGGSIAIQSEKNSGTTFVFTLRKT